MNRQLRYFLITLAAMVLLYFGLSFFLTQLIVYPDQRSQATSLAEIKEDWNKTALAPETEIPEPENFEIESFDGTKLKGWYFKQPDSTQCGMVMAHGWGSNKTGMLKYADLFWDCGCDLAFFDHRGHKPSGGEYGTGGNKEKLDLIEVSEWFAQKTGLPKKNIGWMGVSWGAAAALQAAAMNDEYAFVAADAPFQDWYSAIFERAIDRYGSGIKAFTPGAMTVLDFRTGTDFDEASPLKAASKITIPVFLLHSQTDDATASHQSVNISKELNPEISVFHHTEWGAGHAKDINVNPEGYRELLYAFLKEKLGGFGAVR